MALFDFLKNAGRKIFERGQHHATDDRQKEAVLKEHLENLNLGIENPRVSVNGEKVTIEGRASSQEALEKAILALGNVNGVAQVESRIQAEQAKEPMFYTVKSGDTLSKIAKDMYGNANAYMKIFEANRPLLKDPDEIYPGQKLRVPEKTAQAA